jgi:hypothetical protein
MAYLMRIGEVFGSVFTIDINKNMGQNLADVSATATKQGIVHGMVNTPVTMLETHYTTAGLLAISVLAIYGGILGSMIFNYAKKTYLIKKHSK